ncbi:hypothetical protein O0L34_g10150 [Tuta absoluta]|nr:hypothetical protein O0L34_g10150 [Tuta absoluta]
MYFPHFPAQLRCRRKAAKMLVAVVVMFAVCYFPVHLLSVLRYTMDMEQSDVITFLALISHVLCYANSAINPLIYNFMSGKFRREFRRSFCCHTDLTHDSLSTLTRVTTSKSARGIPLRSMTSRANYNGYRHSFNNNGYNHPPYRNAHFLANRYP